MEQDVDGLPGQLDAAPAHGSGTVDQEHDVQLGLHLRLKDER